MNSLNAECFKLMLNSGLTYIKNSESKINELNIFPIPNNDTGSNMISTFNSGIEEANSIDSNSVSDIAHAFQKGLLLGSKGSSGIIMSQIFKGFANSINEKESLDVNDISCAFENAYKVSYKGVIKPIEGTILTVIKDASTLSLEDYKKEEDMSLKEYFILLEKYAKESLEKGPTLLPILKKENTVDAGAYGLVKIIEGFKDYIEKN